MLSHGKCRTIVICAVLAETSTGTTTHPPYVTVKMATTAVVLHGGQKETRFPLLTSLVSGEKPLKLDLLTTSSQYSGKLTMITSKC